MRVCKKKFSCKRIEIVSTTRKLKSVTYCRQKRMQPERGNDKSNVETDSPTTFHWTLLPQNESIHVLLDLHSKTFDIRFGELRVSRYV